MCVVHPSCPFVVVLLSMLWSCDVTTIALFSTNRRVPPLKSTRVYAISLTSRRLVDSARPLDLYRTSEMKNSKSGYTRTLTILVPKQISVYPGIRINLYQKKLLADIPSLIAGYTARQNRKFVQHIAIKLEVCTTDRREVLNYYCCCCSTCCICMQDAKPQQSIRVGLYSSTYSYS